MLSGIVRDVRHSLRALASSPGFSLAAIAIMAIGIGANTATFTLVDKLVFERLPYPGLDRMVSLAERTSQSGIGDDEVAPADYFDWVSQTASFDRLVAYFWISVNIAGEGQPEHVLALSATPTLFDSLGVPPLKGRAFTAEEAVPGNQRVAVLSYSLWQQHFAGDPTILNKTLKVDGVEHTIIGVMPATFDFLAGSQIWIPLALTPQEQAVRRERYLHCGGQLKDGVTADQAQTEMRAVAGRLAYEHPDTNTGITVQVSPTREQLSGGQLTAQLSLMTLGAVAFVLLIACVNVANLQLARTTGRRKEVALRLALGAGRIRAARFLLVESTLLSFCGAVVGLFVAAWCINLMRTGMPAEMSRFLSGWQDLKLNGRAFAATGALAVLAGIASGIAPALQVSKVDVNEALKQGGRVGIKTSRRAQRVLIVAEVAVALVLLVGAGLMVKGVLHLLDVNSGLHPETVVTMRVTLPRSSEAKLLLRAAFWQQVLARVAAIPGVQSAAVVSNIPFGLGGLSARITVEGRSVPLSERPRALLESVSGSYLRTLRITLRAGREFDDRDAEAAPPVAIVSEAMARRLWPGQNPLGRRVAVDDEAGSSWLTVVGVAADVKQYWFDAEPRATVYRPFRQAPQRTSDFAIRVAGAVSSVLAACRPAVAQVDPDQPVYNLMTMSHMIDTSLRGLEYVAVMMGAFGAIALLLTALGVFGVLGYTVSQQTQEIGIRLALGARAFDVQGRIIREGLSLVGIGFAIGLAMAIAMVRVMSHLIFGVSPLDPWTFGWIAVLLVAVGLIACYLPASRATKIDPAKALREE